MCLFGPPPALARRTAPAEALPRSECGPASPRQPGRDGVAAAAAGLARLRAAQAAESARKRGNPLVIVLPPARVA